MKVYSISNYSPNNNHILQKNKNAKHNISFKGVAIDDDTKKEQNKIYNKIKTLLKDDKKGEKSEIVSKFEEGYRSIKEASEKKLSQVTGFFKGKKKEQIMLEKDSKLSGFLKAQEIAIQIQKENIQLLEDTYRMAKERNDEKEKLKNLEKALLLAEQIKEKTQMLAQNKDTHKGFDSIAGYEEEKYILTSHFINLLPYEMAGQATEIPGGILFFGPIGNGKTSFAKAFAYSAKCKFEEAESSPSARTKEEMEKTFYDNLTSIAKIAQQNYLKNHIRTIILVDEIDRFAYDKSPILSALKKFLENCSEEYHCTVFATTNNPLNIPPAIRGTKRMPIKVAIDPPNKNNAALVFEHYLKDCPNVNLAKINLSELAKEICSVLPNRAYNNSQIEDICKECVKHCDNVTQEDLLYYIRREEPGIDKADLEKYQNETEQIVGVKYDGK